ncbi:MAG: cytidine deaminase [Tannerellaceae bacterium]|nr:cytidine deaminase [Tannerellaceae bacterium]
MKEYTIAAKIKSASINELSLPQKDLIDAARKAAAKAYAPYSNFSVGAAVLLDNSTIVTASNQENAAYPSGICAERVALFYAGAEYPDQKAQAIAIVALTGGRWTGPVSPCGACRQVMLETQSRSGSPMQVLLAGNEECYLIDNAAQLLPLAFGAKDLAAGN